MPVENTSQPQRMEALQPGHVIGAHRIENVVAHGGMGTIYRARDVDSGREVALKVLKRDHSSNPETVRRFLREGQLIARLVHPGIV